MKRIKTLKNGRSTGDGKMAALQIVAEDGTTQDFELPSDEIEDVIQYFAWIAEDAAKKRTGGKPKNFDFSNQSSVAPLPFTHFGIATHPDPNKAVLLFRNYDFDLGFALSLDQWDSIASGARETATLLRGGRNH